MAKWMSLLLLLVAYMALAQKNIDPTEQDIDFAKQLRQQYAKEDAAILESSENITFETSKDGERHGQQQSTRKAHEHQPPRRYQEV